MMRISRLLLVGALSRRRFPLVRSMPSSRGNFQPLRRFATANLAPAAGGRVPRIAGQQKKYIEQQLMAFQKRIRPNIPMVPTPRSANWRQRT